MAIPKKISFVTFDVYGTLIDWETGTFNAFNAEAQRDGFTVERDQLIPLFHEIQQQIQAGSYELYAEVLRRTAVQIAPEIYGEPLRAGNAAWFLAQTLCYLRHLELAGRVRSEPDGAAERWLAQP